MALREQEQARQQQVQEREVSLFAEYYESGGRITLAEVLDIYRGYDPFNTEAAIRSRATQGFSAAGEGPSIAGQSFSASGMSLSNAPTMLFLNWGGGQSLAESNFLLGDRPLATPFWINELVIPGFYQPEQLFAEFPDDAFGSEVDLTGFLDSLEYVRLLRDLEGLERLLAQPFNVVLTWGAGAFDVDLHMTGPTGAADGSRFWIYYAQTGSLEAFPFAQLIRDCICASGSEVILTTRLNQGGVYRISAFNYGNQSTSSTQLSTNADLQLLIVRGGVAVPAGNGTTIEGGRVVFRGRPTPNRPGNTWVGVEIDPRTGQIRFVDRIDNSVNGDGTAAARAARAAPAITAAAAVERDAEPSRRFERPLHAQ